MRPLTNSRGGHTIREMSSSEDGCRRIKSASTFHHGRLVDPLHPPRNNKLCPDRSCTVRTEPLFGIHLLINPEGLLPMLRSQTTACIRRICTLIFPLVTLSACSAQSAELILAALAGGLSGLNASSASDCTRIEGSRIVAPDGTFLGKITSKFDGESIFNPYGTFGNSYSSSSIWNKYSTWGSSYSSSSPFNRYTTSPPQVIKNGGVIGLLTTNTSLYGAIDPYAIRSCYSD